jgi:hypothetical protein
MTTKVLRDDGEVPVGMWRIRRSFERWRKGHTARLPIPERLWASAVQAAREHGVFRTAKVLRLEYGKLKRMAGILAEADVTRGANSGSGNVFGTGGAQGVPAGSGVSECVIALEGSRGKMRIHWKESAAPDLASLSRVLWGVPA